MIGALVHLMNGDFPTTLFGNIMKRIFFVVSGKKYKPHKNMSHCREKRERERNQPTLPCETYTFVVVLYL